MTDFPAPDTQRPIKLPDGSTYDRSVFLGAVVDHPKISVGDYTYYSDFDMPADGPDITARLFPYLSHFAPETVKIGKFCQIAHGVRIITASANHRYDGITSYPFFIMQRMRGDSPFWPRRYPDTIIGNDVWIGSEAMILPGAQIGNGVIIGARAVVGGTVPDYSIVAGNPAKVIRRRFKEDQINRLLDLCWWDWPIDRIIAAEAALAEADIEVLAALAPA